MVAQIVTARGRKEASRKEVNHESPANLIDNTARHLHARLTTSTMLYM